MKPWQKGIELDTLLDYEKIFEAHNSYSDSPFSKIKKNNIAEAIDKKTFHVHTNADASVKPKRVAYIKTVCKKKTDIVLYDGVVIGTKLPGDVVYTGISTDGSDINMTNVNIFDYNKNNWVVSWADDRNLNQFLEARKFRKVGSKITTFAEVQFIWFRDSNQQGLWETVEPRVFPTLPKYELVSLKKIRGSSPTSMLFVNSIASKLADTDNLFQNHYSNYNKAKSWSAYSLRGYKADPTFMTKPIEMNEEWQQDHSDEVFEMQDTLMMEKFPEVYKLLGSTFGPDIEYHRIRLMKLRGGEGELTRHTDQVDPDQGLAIGKLARFHFPIVTNDKVKFTVWDIENKPNTANMKVGECWVLDVRKPHAAINGGDKDRVHLVVDLVVTPEIIKMLEAK